MILWATFMVCNVEYTVYLADEVLDSDDDPVFGLTDHDQCTILMDAELLTDVNRFHRFLWHELGHAFCHESGLSQFLSADAEEMFCQMHSAFVMATSGQIAKTMLEQ